MFFIVWGKKRTERLLGHTADFCHICRAITPFQVRRIGLAPHLYYVSFGEGELVGHLATCMKCGNPKWVDPAVYATFEKHPGLDIRALTVKTYPGIAKEYGERLETEEKIRRRTLTYPGDERMAWLLEPFLYLADQVEERCKGDAKLDRDSGIGCLGTILACMLIVAGSLTVWKTDPA